MHYLSSYGHSCSTNHSFSSQNEFYRVKIAFAFILYIKTESAWSLTPGKAHETKTDILFVMKVKDVPPSDRTRVHTIQ